MIGKHQYSEIVPGRRYQVRRHRRRGSERDMKRAIIWLRRPGDEAGWHL